MKKKHIDILSGIGLMLFAVWGWWQTAGWRESPASAGISNKAYPRAVFAGIFICGLIILARTILRLAQNREDLKEMMDAFKEMHPLRVLIVVALMVVYIYALRRIGFLVTTPVFLFVTMLAYGERRWIKMIVISIIGTLILWAFFVQFMHVHF